MLNRPIMHSPGVYFVPDRFLFDMNRGTVLFSVHPNRYVEYNYDTHQISEWDGEFKTYIHCDFKNERSS